MRRRLRLGGLALFPFASLAALAPSAGARPESVRAGHSYYSDAYVEDGPVLDIGAEKNYEEIYQHHTYYEAVYDAAGRVVIFREYRRGEVVRDAQYRYAPDGTLVTEDVRPSGISSDPAGALAKPNRENAEAGLRQPQEKP